MVGRAIALASAVFAPPCNAEICLFLPVVSDVDIRSALTTKWDTDPAAVAYCEVHLGSPDLCPEPELSPECRSAIVEFVGYGVLRIEAWRLNDEVLFGQVEVSSTGCSRTKTEKRWLPILGESCVFRPRLKFSD